MTQDLWTDVDQYINKLFVPSDTILKEVLQACEAAGLPPIQVSPSQGKLLMILALACQASKILEIGTLGGYSTIWLARALPKGGRLITLELDPKHAEVARSNFARAGLSDLIDLRVGPAIESLPKLVSESHGPFDFIFIDADKPGYADYLAWALQLSHPGTMIVADNVVRHGEIIDSESNHPSTQGARRFNAVLAEEPRLTATIMQTVGVKGYDGFAIALVTARK